MIYLILSILSSTSIYIIFKILHKFKINTFDVIIINYITAAILGLFLTEIEFKLSSIYNYAWFPYSIIIGISFILMFVVIAKSTQHVGIAITTVSNKMSVIIPIAFSIIIDPFDILSNLKFLGILLAILAVFLTVYKKRKIDFVAKDIYLPIILFLGMGIVDSLVKYSQHNFVNDNNLALFTIVLFLMAAIAGLTTKILRKTSFKELLNYKVILWGLLLGISNYGSIYFIIKALNYKNDLGNTFDGSIVFGINNIGIVITSVIIGVIVFKEKLSKINLIGIFISIIAIYVLSNS
ncbi:MAG: EamA/RhaT family transporter [Bacteroidota bacterium]|nr:EamA/RhaT family transporter [Bacteroidota bacterium]